MVSLVKTKNVEIAVVTANLIVCIVSAKPPIEVFDDFDVAAIEAKAFQLPAIDIAAIELGMHLHDGSLQYWPSPRHAFGDGNCSASASDQTAPAVRSYRSLAPARTVRVHELSGEIIARPATVIFCAPQVLAKLDHPF
jgi:hypothetical protein